MDNYGSKKFLFVLILIISISPAAWTKIYTTAEYDFPLKDANIATLASGANMPLTPYEIINIEIRTDRRLVPLAEGRNKVPLGLFEQKNRAAPLAFIIAGTGGSALAGSALYLASQLYLKGFHVVTLPNPIHWHYVLGVSESTLPGYPFRDSPEYYKFLEKTTQFLKSKRNLKISNFSLVGYSYGGLLAGFLAEEDLKQKIFDFKRVVIISPAMNIASSIQTLDKYYSEGHLMTLDRRQVILGTIINVGMKIREIGFDLNIIGNAIKELQLTPLETQWVIGNDFRENLRDVIFTSQQIKDLRLLKIKATPTRKSARLNEAKKVSFSTYFKYFVAPSILEKPQVANNDALNTLLEKSSFYSQSDFIKNNKNIFIITNQDDFLMGAGDVESLTSTANERLYLYPYGGHMGNLWHPLNQHNFLEIFKF